jgi:hypothetical protein
MDGGVPTGCTQTMDGGVPTGCTDDGWRGTHGVHRRWRGTHGVHRRWMEGYPRGAQTMDGYPRGAQTMDGYPRGAQTMEGYPRGAHRRWMEGYPRGAQTMALALNHLNRKAPNDCPSPHASLAWVFVSLTRASVSNRSLSRATRRSPSRRCAPSHHRLGRSFGNHRLPPFTRSLLWAPLDPH